MHPGCVQGMRQGGLQRRDVSMGCHPNHVWTGKIFSEHANESTLERGSQAGGVVGAALVIAPQ